MTLWQALEMFWARNDPPQAKAAAIKHLNSFPSLFYFVTRESYVQYLRESCGQK